MAIEGAVQLKSKEPRAALATSDRSGSGWRRSLRRYFCTGGKCPLDAQNFRTDEGVWFNRATAGPCLAEDDLPKSHTCTYNDLDRLVSAQLASPEPIGFEYFDNDDLQKITRGTGATEVTTDYTYFPEGSIETITTQSPSEQLLGLTYQVDAVLNIDTLTEQHDAAGPNHLYDYGYDALDRLTSAVYPTALGLPSSETFGYDAAGNRDDDPQTSTPWAYDANNRIQASPGKVWVYDDDGNPESVNLGLGDEETFAYDFSNWLRTYTSAVTSTTATYLYDPLGRRIRRTVDGTTTWFVWDGDQLLAEFDGSGVRQRRYTYAEGFAPVEQVDAGSPEVVSQVHADHLDTPRVLTSSSASAVWRGAHEAFGRVQVGAGSSVSHAIRFPGQYEDGESALHYNRSRYYSAPVGRYLSTDPLGQGTILELGPRASTKLGGDQGELRFTDHALYPYAFGAPLVNIDPAGAASFTVGGYGGWGGSVTFGFTPGGSFFVSARGGVGVGLEFGFDPLGAPPGLDCREAPGGTVAVGGYGDVGAAFGPFAVGASKNAGLALSTPGYFFNRTSVNPSLGGLGFNWNSMWRGLGRAFNPKRFKYKASASAGVQVDFFDNDAECACDPRDRGARLRNLVRKSRGAR